MNFDGKPRPVGSPAPGQLMLTMVGEGDPHNVCRRTVFGSIDGLVYFKLELLTVAQPSVATFLREVANQFALQEGALVTA